ncbi:MAG: hypothetical protein L0Z55_08070, partial [Planctomycetes bacterium]|nr:hypothetical protein [Planctomycetota bacterium]
MLKPLDVAPAPALEASSRRTEGSQLRAPIAALGLTLLVGYALYFVSAEPIPLPAHALVDECRDYHDPGREWGR